MVLTACQCTQSPKPPMRAVRSQFARLPELSGTIRVSLSPPHRNHDLYCKFWAPSQPPRSIVIDLYVGGTFPIPLLQKPWNPGSLRVEPRSLSSPESSLPSPLTTAESDQFPAPEKTFGKRFCIIMFYCQLSLGYNNMITIITVCHTKLMSKKQFTDEYPSPSKRIQARRRRKNITVSPKNPHRIPFF